MKIPVYLAVFSLTSVSLLILGATGDLNRDAPLTWELRQGAKVKPEERLRAARYYDEAALAVAREVSPGAPRPRRVPIRVVVGERYPETQQDSVTTENGKATIWMKKWNEPYFVVGTTWVLCREYYSNEEIQKLALQVWRRVNATVDVKEIQH